MTTAPLSLLLDPTTFADTPCREDPETWSPRTLAEYGRAVAGCARCPVRARCEAYSRAVGAVWSGPVVLAGKVVGATRGPPQSWDEGSWTWLRRPREPERYERSPLAGRAWCLAPDRHPEPVLMKREKRGVRCGRCGATTTGAEAVLPDPLPEKVFIRPPMGRGLRALASLRARVSWE